MVIDKYNYLCYKIINYNYLCNSQIYPIKCKINYSQFTMFTFKIRNKETIKTIPSISKPNQIKFTNYFIPNYQIPPENVATATSVL